MIKVKVLNGDDTKTNSENQSVFIQNSRMDDKQQKVLTGAYVRRLNLGISYRIEQRELSHSDISNLIAETQIR